MGNISKTVGDRPARKIEVTSQMIEEVENLLSSVGQVSLAYLAEQVCLAVVAQANALASAPEAKTSEHP